MYHFYIDNVLMPVTPGRFTVKVKNNNKTVDLTNGGEIVIPRSPGLTEISFELLLPSVQYPHARYDNGFKSPNYFLELFERLKANKQPFALAVIRSMSADVLLRYASGTLYLPSSAVSRYDLNGDGKINSADARILLRSQGNAVSLLSPTIIKCLIEDYTVTEDAEKYGGDFNVSLKLKQYREYGVKTAKYSIEK